MNTQMNQIKAQTRTAEMHSAARQARLAAKEQRPSIADRVLALVPSGKGRTLNRRFLGLGAYGGARERTL